jgi:hypothetical protein
MKTLITIIITALLTACGGGEALVIADKAEAVQKPTVTEQKEEIPETQENKPVTYCPELTGCAASPVQLPTRTKNTI